MALSDTVVSLPVAVNRPRYQTLPAWYPYSSLNRTGWVSAWKVLKLLVLSATVHRESSKPGRASGASPRCFQPLRDGNETARGPDKLPTREPLIDVRVATGEPLTTTRPAGANT